MPKRRLLYLLLALSSAGAAAVLAQGLSKTDEQWLERDVEAIITEEERQLFRALPADSDRARFKDIFWARRDPDPTTPENEFREELERRAEVADSRFRARVGPGSRTEMGAVFLLLGFPARVGSGRGLVAIDPSRDGGIPETLEGSASELVPQGARDPAASSEPGGAGGQRIQTWFYPPDEAAGLPDGLEIQFRAQPGYGYRLVRTEAVDRLLEARRLSLVTRPEISYRRDPEGHLEPLAVELSASSAGEILDELMATGKTSDAVVFGVSPAFFRSREGTVYAPLLFELVASDSPTLTFFGAIGKEGNVLHRFEETASFDGGGASYEIPLQLEPGHYDVFVGVLEETSGRYGTRVASVEIPRFEDFTTSSVVLHSGAKESEETGGVPGRAFQFGVLDLAPRVQRPFRRSETLGIFFYVYGAANDPDSGRPKVTARYVFYLNEEEKAQTRPHDLVSADGQAVGTDEIALAGFAPGSYRLLLEVKDEVTGATLERRANFRIEP